MNFLKKIITNEGPRETFNNKKIVGSAYLKNIKYFSFGKKNPNKKFYIINRTPGSGLFSNVTYVLNQLNICDILNFIPIIDMENFPTIYNENKKVNSSHNSWNYYFKPINNYKLKDVYNSKNVLFSSGKFEEHMPLDATNIKISFFFKKIRVLRKIILLSNKFYNNNFAKKDRVLGVHFRGSTYKIAGGHAFPATKEIMLQNVLKLMKKNNYNKIFLVTEEKEYLDFFKKKLGLKCVYSKHFRMEKADSFKIYPRKMHRYKLGLESLIDTLILSRCTGLTYVKSNIISAAILFSKSKIKLHEIFLGYNSRNKFISRWLWFIKSMLPPNYCGLKIIKKISINT